MPIFTVGYGQDDFRTFADRLAVHGIDLLIDVRSNPYSRYDLSYRAGIIENHCAEVGLDYRFLGNLIGGKPKDPAMFDDRGRLIDERLVASPEFQAGLAEVADLGFHLNVAVMCGCARAMACHRGRLISPALAGRGQDVLHIGPDGVLRDSATQRTWEARGQMNLFD